MIPVAEKAIETGDPGPLTELLVDHLRAELGARFDHMRHLQQHADDGVGAARAYVESMLGLQVWAHKLHGCIKADPHEGYHEHA